MPANDPPSKPSDRMTNSGEPMSAPPTTYHDGQQVRSPNNSRRDSARKDQVELWPPKPHVPVSIEHI